MPGPLVIGFDLDMTLVDSGRRILESFRRTLVEVERSVPAETLWRSVGIPLHLVWTEYVPDLDPDTLSDIYRRHYRADDAPVDDPLPGARAALTHIRNRGGQVVVVSAKKTEVLHATLARTGLAPNVDVARGGLFAAEKAGALVAAGASVYVGDHPGDMEAARGAAAKAVGVSTGPHDAAALEAAGADVVLPSLEGFPAWLDAWLAAEPTG